MDGPARDKILSMDVNDNAIYAGTEKNGIFKSTDDGISWSKLNNGLPERYNALSILALESKILLGSDELYTSIDEGENWSKNNSFPNIYGGAHSFLNFDSTIIARPYNGLYISFDNGESWNVRNGNLPLDTLLHYIEWQVDTIITPTHLTDLTIYNDILYAGTDSLGLLFSKNLGLTWSRLDSISPIKTNINSLHIDKNKIMLATNVGVLISTDSAQSFIQINLGEYNIISKIYSNEGKYYATSYEGIFISDDGYNWDNTNDGLSYKHITTLGFTDNKIFTGTYRDGIYYSFFDNPYWIPSNRGFNKLKILSMTNFDEELYVGTALSYVYKYQKDLDNWYIQNPNIYFSDIHELFPQNDVLWAATNNGVYRFSLQNNWQKYSTGITYGSECRSIVGNDSILYTGTWGYGIFISKDNGSSWKSLNNDLSSNSIKKLLLSDSAKELYAISYGELLYKYHEQNGEWIKTRIYFPETHLVYDICIYDSILFVGTENGVFSSSDMGENWIKSNNGLQDNQLVNTLYKYDNLIFASSNNEIYYSLNHGNNWKLFDTKLESTNMFFINNMLIIDSVFYINTDHGIYKNSLNEIITNIGKENSNIIYKFRLEQNYPNPFNPTTKIRYSLPKSGSTKIYLYDILGREIIKLVDEHKEIGSYEIEFNAANLSNGIYFYRIISGNYSETKKMVLLK